MKLHTRIPPLEGSEENLKLDFNINKISNINKIPFIKKGCERCYLTINGSKQKN